jgi:hypothetical protein
MMRSLIVAGFLFASTAFSVELKTSETYTIVSVYDVDQMSEQLSKYLDSYAIEQINDAVKAGYEIEITFESSDLDQKHDPDNCYIKIKEKTTGGGGVKVDGRVVGGEARGGGSTERTIEAKVPCKEVGSILRDITRPTTGKDK